MSTTQLIFRQCGLIDMVGPRWDMPLPFCSVRRGVESVPRQRPKRSSLPNGASLLSATNASYASEGVRASRCLVLGDNVGSPDRKFGQLCH